METFRWEDIENEGKSPERIAKVEKEVLRELDALTLRDLTRAGQPPSERGPHSKATIHLEKNGYRTLETID
ncbi:MAG: hypothetical protein FWD57_13985 [Polyangiaceae bacterium]|nr:hypothetical protein [Polyangiaceae bacterium]